MRDVDWVVANMQRLAKAQKAALKPHLERKATEIPPAEQARRFLAGDERWRVDAGLVSPADFAKYEAEMLRRLGRK